VQITGASHVDWEDLAVGPGPVAGEPYLYIGDIGDNGASRNDIQIYRLPEPTVGQASAAAEELVLIYPNGAHNAEILLVDPVTGDLYIVVKDGSGNSPVYRAAAPLAFGGTQTLELVTTLLFGAAPLVGDTTTTGGDITEGGDAIAIRTYDHAYLWRREPGATIADALATLPCPIPLASEGQGESLGFRVDGGGYYTLSEGTFVPLHYYPKQ
jgi:hypothetical protein